MTGAVLSWVKAGNKQMKSWDNTILGTLRLEPGKLTADVNSERRADRMAREIKRLLGAGATLKSRTAESLSELRARTANGLSSGESPGPERGADRPAEFDELEDDLYVQHLEAWIDTRVPALGNRTPRQAAKSHRGRERLEAMLAGVPEGPGRDRPTRKAARNAMRRTLGLPAEQ